MNVSMRLFARAREVAQTGTITLALPEGATVGDSRRALTQVYPQMAALIERSAMAVNNEYAEDAQLLQTDDELALLPPVSGGTHVVGQAASLSVRRGAFG